MSDVASRKLSEELYKLSGWEETSDVYAWVEFIDEGFDDEAVSVVTRGREEDGAFVCSAFDAGYLLRKLPVKILDDADVTRHFSLRTRKRTNNKQSLWRAGYGKLYQAKAHTPEDALAKLAIELHKAGILPISGRD